MLLTSTSFWNPHVLLKFFPFSSALTLEVSQVGIVPSPCVFELLNPWQIGFGSSYLTSVEVTGLRGLIPRQKLVWDVWRRGNGKGYHHRRWIKLTKSTLLSLKNHNSVHSKNTTSGNRKLLAFPLSCSFAVKMVYSMPLSVSATRNQSSLYSHSFSPFLSNDSFNIHYVQPSVRISFFTLLYLIGKLRSVTLYEAITMCEVLT